jgi:hypothetical protein
MRTLVTFSGAPYDATTRQIVQRAPALGADAVIVYDDRWLVTHPFFVVNRWLWDHPHKRGFGWYAWKPLVILQTLAQLHDGDTVLYVDADTVPIAPFGVLFDLCAQQGGVLLFASEGHRQVEWCKRDCYVVMGQDDPRYYDVPAGVARFAVFQKGSWLATQLLSEWLAYAVHPLATTFDPSVLRPELPGFIEHRAEQAILTNLAHKYGVTLHREACAAGNGSRRDRDCYGQLFEQINADVEHVSSPPLGSAYANA